MPSISRKVLQLPILGCPNPAHPISQHIVRPTAESFDLFRVIRFSLYEYILHKNAKQNKIRAYSFWELPMVTCHTCYGRVQTSSAEPQSLSSPL